jgi:hypothetical protein
MSRSLSLNGFFRTFVGAGGRQREADGAGVVLGAVSGVRGVGGEGSAEVEAIEGGGVVVGDSSTHPER